jgi:hypothetical protein
MSNSSQLQNSYVTSSDIDTITTISIPTITGSSIWTDSTMNNGINYTPYYDVTTTPTQYTIQNSNGVNVLKVPNSDVPSLEVTGDIVLNGDSMSERLERIETMLQIPTRDVTIEEQYPKLKKLYEQYMAELEKCKTWNRLTKGTEK